MSDAGPITFTCPRHKVETPLTCVTCETPICPDCYVRTAVGLRCPKCGEGVTVKVGGRPKWQIGAAIALAVAVLALIVVLATGGGDTTSNTGDPVAGGAEPGTGEGGAAPGYRLVARPEQGFSVEVPQQWQAQADDGGTTLSYAETRPTEGSLRVNIEPAGASLADAVTRLTSDLTAQGGREFARTDTQLGSTPAIRLNYLFPAGTTPGSPLATRTSYLAVHNGRLYSFQLATIDPGAKDSVFRYMATKFALL